MKKFKNILKNITLYLKTNVLVTTFIVSNLINGILLRYFTVKNYFNIKPIIADITILSIISAFGYLIKPKHQFKYFISFSIVLTIICLANSIYYSNYLSYISVSLLKTSSQLGGYTDALTNIIETKDFIYLWQLFAMTFIHLQIKKKDYYNKVKEVEIGKVRFINTLVVALICFGAFVSMLSTKDISRLNKQWDRRYVVMEFGVYTYQINDIVSSVRAKVNSMFGYDDAAKTFRDYYENKEEDTSTNMYTNLFEGKNVIAIHAESIQNFTLNLSFNDKELTPNLNKLASEGVYFSNFYSQESVGNSSDSEFTSLSSLMPSTSGTVFVNYFDRKYVTTTDLLRQKGYYTFSMHANVASAWNRSNAYKYLGYDNFYAYTDAYTIDEKLGLGLSDKSFFSQSVDIIKKIKENNGNFYGTLIMLTNHTPFTALEDSDEYSVDLTREVVNEKTGKVETKTVEYLEGTKMGNYLKSVNYADSAIGQLINDLETNGLLDDTIIIIYGDHDCKLKKSEFRKLYESEYIDEVLIDNSEKIDKIDDYTYELNRKVPFIIWSKDLSGTKYNQEVTKVMGMIDIMPTLGNMLGIKNKYALGNDIFSTEENVVVFPNGSFITDKLYYNSSLEEYRQLDLNTSIAKDYVEKYQKYADNLIAVSNSIITYDLIEKYEEEQKLLNNQ